MKKLFLSTILSLLCLLTAFFSGAFPLLPTPRKYAATADEGRVSSPPTSGDYACILQEDTFLYSTPDEGRGLFLLPTTYYVKLLDYGTQYCRVEYLYDDSQVKKLVGYVKTSRLTFVDYLPKRPYFYLTFDLNYRIDEALMESSDFLTEITLSCTYYGDYKIGSKTYCYVLRGEAFGYVPKPATLTVPENTEYAEYLESLNTAAPIEPDEPTKESSPAQIAILVALCLLVPVLAALILKPPRRPPYETDLE